MTAPRTSIEVEIAGEQYALSSEVDEDYARRCARIVDERMSALASNRSISAKNAAILTALALTDELLREREAVGRRLGELTQSIENALDARGADSLADHG